MKKTTKILVATALAIVMVFALVACVPAPAPAPVLGKVKLDKEAVSFAKLSETVTLVPTVENGTLADVVWASSKPEVATVSNGVVIAVGKGSTDITATVGKEVATCKVIVSANFSLKVTSAPVLNLKFNGAAEAEKTATIAYKQTLETIYQNEGVKFSSSDVTVATVDKVGNVVALKQGVAVITVKTVECPSTVAPGMGLVAMPESVEVPVIVDNEFDAAKHAALVGSYVGSVDWEGVAKSSDNGALAVAEKPAADGKPAVPAKPAVDAKNIGWIKSTTTLTLKADGTFVFNANNMKRAKYERVGTTSVMVNAHPFNAGAQVAGNRTEGGKYLAVDASTMPFNTNGSFAVIGDKVFFAGYSLNGTFADPSAVGGFLEAPINANIFGGMVAQFSDCNAMAVKLVKLAK